MLSSDKSSTSLKLVVKRVSSKHMPIRNPRRIFMDVVSLIGDKLAINHGINFNEHTATDPSGICNFRQLDKNCVGSACECTRDSNDTSAMLLSVLRDQAVIDCNPSKSIRQSLGIKSNLPRTVSVFHVLHEMVNTLQSNWTCVADNLPLLPKTFHPYLAALVSPDHLLAELMKNVNDFALNLLPASQGVLYIEDSLRSVVINDNF